MLAIPLAVQLQLQNRGKLTSLCIYQCINFFKINAYILDGNAEKAKQKRRETKLMTTRLSVVNHIHTFSTITYRAFNFFTRFKC